MLIVQDNLAGRYLRELPLSPLPRVPPTKPLYDMLKDFQTGKSAPPVYCVCLRVLCVHVCALCVVCAVYELCCV